MKKQANCLLFSVDQKMDVLIVYVKRKLGIR